MATTTTAPGAGNVLNGDGRNVYGNGVGTASAGANTIIHYYDRAGVKAANRVNLYGQFADRKSMPKKMGKTFKISKFLHMYDRERLNTSGNVTADFESKGYMTARSVDAVSTELSNVQLAEGAGRENQQTLKKITMETSFARYGEMIDYTDEVELFSEDAIQVRYREELGELANSRMEDLIQLDLLSTGTVMYSGAASSLATVGAAAAADGADDDTWKVSYDLIRKGVRKLVRNRAKKNSTLVAGSTKIDTRTIAKAYYAIIGANVKGDLETLTRGSGSTEEFVFIPAHKYASAATLAEGEVGAMHEVRFIESESALVYEGEGAAIPGSYVGDLSNNGSNFDVFPILFPTEGAFATVGLKGNNKIKFNSKAPSEVELSNPYGTQGFFSYNFWYAGIILEEEKLLKILVAASA